VRGHCAGFKDLRRLIVAVMVDPERPAGSGDDQTSMDVRLGLSDPLLTDLKREGKTIAELQVGGPKKRPKITHKLFFEDEKGLDKMLKTFSKIKFRGKGNEYQDLSLLLQHYRKWFQDLYPYGEHFEDMVWKARQVLQDKIKDDDDGTISDPRELLHTFRLKYKSAAAAASGAHLSDEAKARIEANRQRALELKRKKEAEATGKAPAPANEELDMEEIFRMEEEYAAASKVPSFEAPAFGSFDEDEDVFGYGGFDDDFDDPAPRAPASAPQETKAPPATSGENLSDDAKARIEANRQRALELKRKKEAEAVGKAPATVNEEKDMKETRMEDEHAAASIVPAPVAPVNTFDEEEDIFGGGFDDMDDPGGFDGGFDDP